MKKTSFLLAVLIPVVAAQAQQPGTPAIMKESKPGYYQNTIMKDIRAVDESSAPAKTVKRFQADLSGMSFPNKVSLYQQEWRLPPVSQGNTNTCWCFSTTSFFESEVKRISGQEIKLSEMFTVYWEYVEKAKRYIREKGNSAFEEGSEANALTRIWKEYGCVPAASYTGMLPGQKFHDHGKMFGEMKTFLNYAKGNNLWNEDIVLSTIKSILNSYMGVPPVSLTIEGKSYTPKEYLKDVVKLNPDDYVDFMSLMEKPYFQQAEYEVPDNWWHSADYYNLPLDDYMSAIISILKSGYTIEIGGDVSEAGYESHAKAAVIPTFDIPSDFIDENARQFRFSNNTSTDDHGIHVIGYTQKDGVYWFLIKDSGSGSFNNGIDKGYYYYHQDYIKLKMLSFMVHKSAAEDILKKFSK